jgi:hypothetical protein
LSEKGKIQQRPRRVNHHCLTKVQIENKG